MTSLYSSELSSSDEDNNNWDDILNLDTDENDDRHELESSEEVGHGGIVLPDINDAEEDTPTVVHYDESNNNDCTVKWNDQLLFPPSVRKLKNPSVVWKFGGFPKVDGKLILEKIICSLCGKHILYQNSPGNFRRHLEAHHRNELDAEENRLNQKKSKPLQTITNHFMPISNSSVKKYKPNNVKQKAFRKKLGEWVVASLRPFSIVEDE